MLTLCTNCKFCFYMREPMTIGFRYREHCVHDAEIGVVTGEIADPESTPWCADINKGNCEFYEES